MTGTGQITEEGLARLRATIGIAVPHTQPPHYQRPNEDAFRHVAESYGDDNPLWWDPEYAAKSVWGESIAPPALAASPGDTSRPSVFAVFMLITNSNLVGWTMGRSAGFSHLRSRLA